MKNSHSQRFAVSAIFKSAASVTLVHAYDDILSTVSRTAGEVALLLGCGVSAEQATVLDTDS